MERHLQMQHYVGVFNILPSIFINEVGQKTLNTDELKRQQIDVCLFI